MIQVARVVGEVRRVLQDLDPDRPRHNDSAIKGAMYLALQDMRRMRPDVFLGIMDAVPDPLSTSVTEVNIDAMFTSPLVHLTTAYLMMTNSEYNQDGSAANFLALARMQLMGPG
jgi:hypothetical protein